MKRLLIAALIAATALTTTTMPAGATGRGPCSEDRYEVTVQMSREMRVSRMQALIRCVFNVMDIGAQVPTAFAIAERESSYWPWARNPNSDSACHPWGTNPYGSCGLFQHLARYWPARAHSYLPDWAFKNPHPGIRQARANVWVTARMVKASGWCHWTPPYYCS